MIVITGPGRSGTSLLARIYQELGFDPTVGGGGWEASINGGLEDIEIGVLNQRIIEDLGMRSPVYRLADRLRAARRAASRQSSAPGSEAGADARAPARPGLSRSLVMRSLVMNSIGRQIRLLQWDRVDAVVARYGEEIRELSRARVVVKDPQFCQTLWVWAAAGADIDHVVVSVRSVEATAKRLLDSGHLPWWAERQARNHVAYRLGLVVTALHDHRLSHAFLRFPDFLDEPETLFDALRFPPPVERGDFLEVFEAIRDPGAVHIWK
jgi:hypothetical protein